jgi:hypothetical protein
MDQFLSYLKKSSNTLKHISNCNFRSTDKQRIESRMASHEQLKSDKQNIKLSMVSHAQLKSDKQNIK